MQLLWGELQDNAADVKVLLNKRKAPTCTSTDDQRGTLDAAQAGALQRGRAADAAGLQDAGLHDCCLLGVQGCSCGG